MQTLYSVSKRYAPIACTSRDPSPLKSHMAREQTLSPVTLERKQGQMRWKIGSSNIFTNLLKKYQKINVLDVPII